MKVFTCNDHEGFWPAGTASVIVAESEEQARKVLIAALKNIGLDQDENFTLQSLELNPKEPYAKILRDGDY